ncbi:tigger transposable element-derived protein 6-like [Stomoxys calcitrans]|uniref:tigger transposable element-derived protein 6-like n=1 Tax=Stomoxys calcitrans TaxID=35570 RepID=UPI0027E2F141|nr:tigger transposable element-derived protein 6-like [Stomoxys calcitrans]
MRSKEATISGPIIMQKAKDLAHIMNIDFVPTIGWLERWKKRENIHFKKLHGEKNSANTVAASEWIKNILPEMLKNYSEDDIYNADETALLYKALPGGTLANRSDQPSGSKISKDRITLLFITNSTGSDKYVFSVGKSSNSRCFKGKNLPVNYSANKKAWMTSILWTEIIKELDLKFQKKTKNILLFIDNAACHKISDDVTLKNIRIEYLPPNTTSIIQPLDQGIIRSFKCFYRKLIISKQLLHLECSGTLENFSKKIDVFEALSMVKNAWSTVTTETVKNCFRKAGFVTGEVLETVEEEDSILNEIGNEIEHFIEIEKDLECCEDLTEEEIVEQVIGREAVIENEEIEMDEAFPKPTVKEAYKLICQLKDFFSDNFEARNLLNELENKIAHTNLKKMTQSQIKDYFKGHNV